MVFSTYVFELTFIVDWAIVVPIATGMTIVGARSFIGKPRSVYFLS